jgi:hypothetical protein
MIEQTKSPRRAALIVFQRELRGRLVNISRSGCLIEVSRPVRVGTVCRLRVALDNTEYADDVRVARCTSGSGNGATCELGLELLRVPKPKEPRSHAPSVALILRASGVSSASAGLWLTGT